MVDRARILRPDPDVNKQVVTRRGMKHQQWGDWIPARLRPVRGTESRQSSMVKLVHNYELILHHHDESGNEVCITESDRLEIIPRRNLELLDESDAIQEFKIVGSIQEVRKRTKVVSYIVPVAYETEA